MKLDFHNEIPLKACLNGYLIQNLDLKYCRCKSHEYSCFHIAVRQMAWIISSPFVYVPLLYNISTLLWKTCHPVMIPEPGVLFCKTVC